MVQNSYNSLMKIASISQTKNRLSHYLNLVKHGETVLIQDRGKAVARLESVGKGEESFEGDRALRLERLGLVARPRRKLTREFLRQRPPKVKPGGNIIKTLPREREESP